MKKTELQEKLANVLFNSAPRAVYSLNKYYTMTPNLIENSETLIVIPPLNNPPSEAQRMLIELLNYIGVLLAFWSSGM